MVQTLKRVYLYTAATFALLFTAAMTILLLNTLLNQAGMLAYYVSYDGSIETTGSLPDPQQVETNIILFVITLVLVGVLFGGGHYWLIRRDARSDPGADGGAVRHVFLNGLLALAVLFAVPFGLAAISDVDQTEGSHDTAVSLSFAIVAALVFLFIFLERRRVNPAGRAAPIIRQIQEDGVQAILLIIASAVLFGSISAVIHWVLVQNHAVAQCNQFFNGPEGVLNACPSPPLLGPLLQVPFAIAAWALYVWMGAWSDEAVLKRVLWFGVLGYGVIWLLYGIAQAGYTGVATLFGDANAWQDSLDSALPFVGGLVTGLLVVTPYILWIQRLAGRTPRLRESLAQGLVALPAVLSAGFFLTGLILLLQGVVEQVVQGGNPPDADGWATATGILIAGLLYPILWVRLWLVSDPALGGPTIPRRVSILALLAGTAIGALIAAVFMVYQIVASALGLSSANAQVARQSGVILVVLGAAALYHLWQLRVDLRVSRAQAAAAQPVPATAPLPAGEPAEPAVPAEGATPAISTSETLEVILRRVYVGALDPTSAAARIRSLPKL